MPKAVIEGFRLSPQQEHLWLIQQTGQSEPYRVQGVLRIEGRLELAALTAALEHVFNRHEILRTTFHQAPGLNIPLQVITTNTVLTITPHNLSDVEPSAQPARLNALFDELGRQPFNLEHGPLWRVALVTLSPTCHSLLFSLPALCADAATLTHLMHEISRAYAACLQHEVLAAEPMQYADLAEWQHDLLEAEDTAAGRAYWHKQDWPDLFSLKLPFETQPPASAEFEPQLIAVELKPELVAQVEKLAQKYAVSPAAIWQSCWHILLWRYSGRSDLVVGLAGDGRTHAELQDALGLLSRYLPVASLLEESTLFIELLSQVSRTAQEVSAWQDFFHWDVLDKVADKAAPIFLPFNFEFMPRPLPVTVGEVTFSLERRYVCIDRFKMKLAVLEAAVAEFHYDAGLFEAADMQRLAGQFVELLASAVRQPEAAIGALNLLTAAERRQLLFGFNQTHLDFPADGCIHHLFEAQAERVPKQVAVMFEGQALTYAELNWRANQLAHYLQGWGVGPETPVAIFVERSLDMIVGMLGILKAGGAYVPFDPTLPKERLAFLLNDTQAPVLLTQQHLAERLTAAPHNSQVICLDTDWELMAQQPEQNPASEVQSHHLAYVLFTSGSTGQPKGVMIEHRQLLNYLHGITARLELPAGANYATVSTFAADLGNTVIFPALCGGGCLYIITHERATDPDALAAYFQRYQIDCLKLVPSHLAALFASAQPEQIMPRQYLILGGETSHWDLVRKAQALAPDCLIFNHYGPTETTVGVLTYPVSQALASQPPVPTPSTVPLGRPLANTQIYLLDSYQQPVPIWLPGEVYIGGAGVARGYLNRPELTTERFIDNPLQDFRFSIADFGLGEEDPKPTPAREVIQELKLSRLYRTGDLARYLPDGSVEFLGRIDNQVKIRGFRIELGEIEAMLGQHPAVQETVVIAREDHPGDKRLVAYLVPEATQTPTSTELRAFLKEKLPEPMLPTAFVLLDKLPLTSNGKINRRALPVPDAAHLAFEETYVAPRNAIEEALADLWANILGLERVGIRDNFFDLGGHSLLAVRLMAQIQRWFGRDLPLATLFQEGTIEHLAALLSQQIDTRPSSPLVKIQASGTKLPFFCVHPADGTVLSYVALARYLGEDQPFYGLQVTHVDKSHSARTRLKVMAADYIESLRAVQPQGPYLLGGWSMGGLVAFEMAQQLRRLGQPVALLALLDSWVPDSDPRYPDGYQPVNGSPHTEDDLETQLLLDFLRHLRGRYAKDLPVLSDDFHPLSLDEKLHYIVEHAKMLEFVFPEGGLSQLYQLWQVFKANVQAMSNYTPQLYPGRITLFQATEWFAAAQHPHGQMPDSAIGWRRLSSEALEVYPLPGDHYTILAEPHIRVLADQLKVCLNEAQLVGVTP